MATHCHWLGKPEDFTTGADLRGGSRGEHCPTPKDHHVAFYYNWYSEKKKKNFVHPLLRKILDVDPLLKKICPWICLCTITIVLSIVCFFVLKKYGTDNLLPIATMFNKVFVHANPLKAEQFLLFSNVSVRGRPFQFMVDFFENQVFVANFFACIHGQSNA